MRILDPILARLGRLVFSEQGQLRVRRVPLALPAWRAEPLRAVVASDFHAGAPDVDVERLGEIVDVIHAQSPDIVLLAGDFIDLNVAMADEEIRHEEIASALGRLGAPLGVFAVLGNHDWVHGGRRMAAALSSNGIRVLENEAVEVRDFWLAGLADELEREADLAGTLDLVPGGATTLLMAHNPDVFPEVPASVALTVAGHTHGAQVDVPVLRDKLTPSKYGARYTGGHVEEGGRHLYVSTGIGTSRLPIRWRAKPEVAVLEVRPAG